MLKSVVAIALACAGLAACSPKGATDHGVEGEAPATSISAGEASAMMRATPMPVVDLSPYTGKWTGVEGTSLVITPKGEEATVIITNLDGPVTFTGTPTATGIRIERDGKTLMIRKGDGEDTGMKWLADKSDCLVVDANEGYCRD